MKSVNCSSEAREFATPESGPCGHRSQKYGHGAQDSLSSVLRSTVAFLTQVSILRSCLISFLKSCLHAILSIPLALLLLFEEWGWEPLSRGMAWLATLPLWARLERTIRALSPQAALVVLLLPVLLLFPVKLLAIYWFGTGHQVWGMVLLISAKLAGTAIIARLFHLTEPTLMQLAWFARWYPRWKRWKDALMDKIRTSPTWLLGRRAKTRLKAWWADRR